MVSPNMDSRYIIEYGCYRRFHLSGIMRDKINSSWQLLASLLLIHMCCYLTAWSTVKNMYIKGNFCDCTWNHGTCFLSSPCTLGYALADSCKTELQLLPYSGRWFETINHFKISKCLLSDFNSKRWSLTLVCFVSAYRYSVYLL